MFYKNSKQISNQALAAFQTNEEKLNFFSARAGDMMSRNLRAARWLDFTNEDDDDGLYQLSDSDSEVKRKT